jgi:hypothetical protein
MLFTEKAGVLSRADWVEYLTLEGVRGGHVRSTTTIIDDLKRWVVVETSLSNDWGYVTTTPNGEIHFRYLNHPNESADSTFGHITVSQKGSPDISVPVFITIHQSNTNRDYYDATIKVFLHGGEMVITKMTYPKGLFELPLSKHVERTNPNGEVISVAYYMLVSLNQTR